MDKSDDDCPNKPFMVPIALETISDAKFPEIKGHHSTRSVKKATEVSASHDNLIRKSMTASDRAAIALGEVVEEPKIDMVAEQYMH